MTHGDVNAAFSAGATDIGSGVDHVTLLLDHGFEGQFGLTSGLTFLDSVDSFSDGASSLSQYFSSSTAAGTYNVTFADVYDKAGNETTYTASQLASMGIATSFQVVDHNATPTATVSAPTSVVEGNDTSIICRSRFIMSRPRAGRSICPSPPATPPRPTGRT